MCHRVLFPATTICQPARKKESAMDDHGESDRLTFRPCRRADAVRPSHHGARLLRRHRFLRRRLPRALSRILRARPLRLPRLAGVHHTELADGKHGEKLVWVVRRMEIDFRAPPGSTTSSPSTRAPRRFPARASSWPSRSRRGDDVLVEAKVEAAIIGETGARGASPRSGSRLHAAAVNRRRAGLAPDCSPPRRPLPTGARFLTHP
jgi:acyl-CoA thioester hydrolase